jgi:hypothetical protein
MEFATFEVPRRFTEPFFSAYRWLWNVLTPNRLFLIEGIVEEDFGVVALNVKQLNRLDLTPNSC